MSIVAMSPAEFGLAAICVDCGKDPRNRWGSPLPKRSPKNLAVEHIEETFRIHPWLLEMQVGALARAIRDSVVSSA